jgi:hypothetical protein
MRLKNTFVILSCLLLPTILNAQTDVADINNDGILNILVIGTNESINNSAETFSPDQISFELQSIIAADTSITIDVNIVAEDIYRTNIVPTGIGYNSPIDVDFYCHSLVQYYYWPDGYDTRIENLKGNNGIDWDYVVIGADPYMVSKLPGYYALGVNKIAAKVKEGDAVPLLLMMWPEDETLIAHFEEFTYRASEGAKVQVETIPAGLAWENLPASKKDTASVHPTPNGAYLTAAAIYSYIYDRSASLSQYVYDDQIADIVKSTLDFETNQTHYVGERVFMSPFKNCEITDTTLIYNHGGTSTENGILNGLQWVVTEAQKTLQYGETPPIHFNYGRSSMGNTHLYTIDPILFDFSLGYPLQDNPNNGMVSMVYGIDKRVSSSDVETDLGVARHMINQSELPFGRTVPIRTIAAQLIEEVTGIEIYSDTWHISTDLNKAIAAFMYTLLTSDCAFENEIEPIDNTSPEWRTWMSHKIGYTTAWTLMYMEGLAPCYNTQLSTVNHEDSDFRLIIHPNPTSGNFNIDLGYNFSSVKITINDLNGKQIQSETFHNKQLLNLSLKQPTGIYLLVIESGDRKSTIRLVKE